MRPPVLVRAVQALLGRGDRGRRHVPIPDPRSPIPGLHHLRHHKLGIAYGDGPVVVALKYARRLREGPQHQAVPGHQDLVVAPWVHPLFAHLVQLLPAFARHLFEAGEGHAGGSGHLIEGAREVEDIVPLEVAPPGHVVEQVE